MRRRVIAVGWGLVCLIIAVIAIIVTVGPFRAHGDTAFTRWGVWAAVAAVILAAIGTLATLLDKMLPNAQSSGKSDQRIEEELARVVLREAEFARSRLIGPGEPGDQVANVRFVKGTGRFRQVGGASEGDLASVLEYYSSLSPRRLVVLGAAGAGKTVLITELQAQLLEHREQSPGEPVPIIVSAAAYDTRTPWPMWLAGHIALRFSISSATASRLVSDGRILPLVDGIDEMDPTDARMRAQALVIALNEWMRGRNRAPVVITCRAAEYQELMRDLDRATHVEMVPLSASEQVDYLRNELNPRELRDWEPVLATLEADPHGAVATQLATPWRLTQALAAVRDRTDPRTLLPVRADEAGYVDRVDRLLLDGYVTSAVRLHSAGRYSPAQVTRWLTTLADGLAWQAFNGGSPTDLQLTRLWEMAGRLEVGLAYGLAIANLGIIWFMAIVGYFIIIGAPAGLISSLIYLGSDIALFSVVVVALYSIFFEEIEFRVARLADDSPEAIKPRDPVQTNSGLRLMIGIAAIYSILLAISTGVGIAVGIIAGVAVGLIVGVASAGRAWARYRIAVIIFALRRDGPLRFVAFLDWAHRAGLLRVSGVAYQFRHIQLQDWLTSQR